MLKHHDELARHLGYRAGDGAVDSFPVRVGRARLRGIWGIRPVLAMENIPWPCVFYRQCLDCNEAGKEATEKGLFSADLDCAVWELRQDACFLTNYLEDAGFV